MNGGQVVRGSTRDQNAESRISENNILLNDIIVCLNQNARCDVWQTLDSSLIEPDNISGHVIILSRDDGNAGIVSANTITFIGRDTTYTIVTGFDTYTNVVAATGNEIGSCKTNIVSLD